MSTNVASTRRGTDLPMDRILTICKSFDVARLAVFGSFLREDFRPESDIDFLVRFRNDDYGPWMGKLSRLEAELTTLLNRRVDLVPWENVERSENWIRKAHILGSAQVIYES